MSMRKAPGSAWIRNQPDQHPFGDQATGNGRAQERPALTGLSVMTERRTGLAAASLLQPGLRWFNLSCEPPRR